MEMLVVIGIIGFTLFLGVMLYNRMVALQQRRTQAFSDIDVQLKQRHDLIPNLVETVKGYATHEKGVFESVTAARATAMKESSVDGRVAAEGVLGAAMMKMMAVAENYPQLKADSNFLALQAELSDIENKIAAARRFFNNATTEYNTAIMQFPAVIVARMFGFHQEIFFELTESEKTAVAQAPSVKF